MLVILPSLHDQGSVSRRLRLTNKLDLNYGRPFMTLVAFTICWHWSLKGRTNHGHKFIEFTFFDNLKNVNSVDL